MKLTAMFVTVCCGLVLFAGCKKSNDKALSPIGQMLVAGKWQMSAYTATLNYMGQDTTIDMYAIEKECDKDDFVTYASDGTGIIDENANKCADDGQTESFGWELQNNDTKLALIDDNPDTFDLEAASTQMKIKITKPNSTGTAVHYAWTFKNIR